MNTMRNRRPAPGNTANTNLAGIAATTTIAAIFALAWVPAGGTLFLALLGVAIVMLAVCVWARARDGWSGNGGGSGGSGGGSAYEGGGTSGSHDDGVPSYYAAGAFLDSTPSGVDENRLGCGFDAPSGNFSDSSSSYSSDAGSSPGDCGSGSASGSDY